MPKATRYAGALRDDFDFMMRGAGSDGWGNTGMPTQAFAKVFAARVNLTPRTGTEAVIADNLKGVQPYIVTMRWSEEAMKVTNGWAMKENVSRGKRFLNVISLPTDPDGKRQWLEFIATMGPPT